MSDSISCPNCNFEIPLTEAISHQVEERLRGEFAKERAKIISEQSKLVEEKDRLLQAKDEEIESATKLRRCWRRVT